MFFLDFGFLNFFFVFDEFFIVCVGEVVFFFIIKSKIIDVCFFSSFVVGTWVVDVDLELGIRNIKVRFRNVYFWIGRFKVFGSCSMVVSRFWGSISGGV